MLHIGLNKKLRCISHAMEHVASGFVNRDCVVLPRFFKKPMNRF